MDFPVIIVGGGPSGTVCSIHLSSAGIQHLILESEKFPRDKACADILTSKAIRELNLADARLIKEIEKLPSYQDIWGTLLKIENNEVLDIPYHALEKDGEQASSFAVRRKELDELLWNEASSKPFCSAIDGEHVKHIEKKQQGYEVKTRNGISFRTSFIVLAAGSHNRLIKSIGLKDKEAERHTAIGLRAYYSGVKGLKKDRCELYLRKDTMPGCFYIAPLGDGSCNVNVVLRKDLVKRKDLNLREVMAVCFAQDSALAKRFENAVMESAPIGQSLHLATIKRKKYAEGVFLCGDSGGLIDLISANGIPQALCSARLAATSIAGIISGVYNLEEAGVWYGMELERTIASDMKMGRMLSPLMGLSWFNALILGALSRGQGQGEGGFMQELLYAEEPWKALIQKLNPLQRTH
jgi:flavin-dependent dehydrogenase